MTFRSTGQIPFTGSLPRFLFPALAAYRRKTRMGRKNDKTMAEEQQTTATPEAKPEGQASATTPAEVKNTETTAEHMIPKSRFDEVNDKLRKLESDAAKKAKADADEDERRKVEQGEWQKLADQRKAKVEELTPKVELADKLSAMVLEQYTAEIATWPEQVKAMAPAADADVLTKLDWMKRAKPLATELMGDKIPVPGNGRRPQPVSPTNRNADLALQRRDSDNMYQPF